MINTDLLEDIIRQRGMKKSYLAERLGVTRQTFDAYLKNRSEFKVSQVNALCEILAIEDPALLEAIFFAPNGALKAPST
jgi:transcriptional regulator with XRE-family HTH domain